MNVMEELDDCDKDDEEEEEEEEVDEEEEEQVILDAAKRSIECSKKGENEDET